MAHIAVPDGVPGIRSLVMFRPETGKHLYELAQVLLRDPSPLTPAERELIATHVSERNNCAFCMNSHAAAARELGIGMVFQHFSLFDTLTVAENIALGLPKDTRLDELERRIADTAQQYGLELQPQRHVHTLSVGECQRVEIVRALLGKPQLLILDEPTSVLTPQAVDQLFDTLRALAREGTAILYVSHKLDEIRRLCDRATILRGGRKAGEVDPRTQTEAGLAELMIGRSFPKTEKRPHPRGADGARAWHLQRAPRRVRRRGAGQVRVARGRHRRPPAAGRGCRWRR